MAKAIALYKGGIHSLKETAVRTDGVVFSRYQSRTPYGYRWGAWSQNGTEKWGANMVGNPPNIYRDMYKCNDLNSRGEIRRRLPN